MEDLLIKKGSLIGGILLVAGCCVGAGMLGLPVLSAQAGFVPSALIFFLCWMFMLATGLLLLEVNLWFGGSASMVTMAEKTVGRLGKAVSWIVFLFLFYSLMIAYITATGSLMSDFISQWFGAQYPHAYASLAVSLFFGLLIYLGIGAVDWFNRLLMLGLILSYGILIVMGVPHVKMDLLMRHDWSASTLVIPAVIVSFGFHNLIPSLTQYYKGSSSLLIKAITFGSLIPLCIYLIWEWIILGLVDINNFKIALDHGEIATEALKGAVGVNWILEIAQSFAFFAITTSFLSVSLSFVDFLADGLGIKKSVSGNCFLVLLAILPPLIFSLIYPDVFLVALNYAGGYGAIILFGILPVLMVWKGRYHQKRMDQLILPGGKAALMFILACSLFIIGLQVFQTLKGIGND